MSSVSCIELIAFLDAYVDDELDSETRGDFDRHLLVCPSCRAYLATYKETIDLARGAAEREEDLAHDAPPELIEAVLTSKSRRPKS
ncbi:MAG: zf-HC2 domain-containing protein [Acidobacteria bacterium]|nr:zf-HC2 domain-containing protein [Acidobacteriota bacterium]MBV9070923.1 zf-HC2 domain-containing protein [Acidobacteriota bacterium]MBV9185241.1 zf-HC2 domain-containing protein [Acidobacteriota bacterium]